MRRGFILMSALVAAAALAAVDADRQPFSHWDESKLSPPQYRVRVVNKVRIKMRDGVELSTDVYLPDAPGKYPALLWRNCYGKNGAADQSAWFASRGYAVVHQDTRGKYESGGRWVHFRDEADNGFDTDEWIGAQPWSNGKIGLMGGSYLGYTQIAQAVRRSKYLASMSASVTTGDVYNGWVYSDGALFLGFTFPWGAVVMDAKEMQFETASPWPEIFNHLPLMTMDEKAGHPNPNYREWLEHPRADDSFWKDL